MKIKNVIKTTMNKKYTIVGLLVFFLWIPFSFAQEVSLNQMSKKLFEEG